MKRIFSTVLAALVIPAAAVAQQQTPDLSPEARQEIQSAMIELRQVGAELQPIAEQALRDPEIQAERQTLQAEVQVAMQKADPELAPTMERMETLAAEARQAQQSGDQAKLQQVTAEAQQIQMRLASVQGAVLQQPEIAAKAAAFENRLQTKMIAIDPEAEALLDRAAEIQAEVEATVEAEGQR